MAVSRTRRSPKIKQLVKQVPDLKIIGTLLWGLQQKERDDADRSIAILGGALVENALKQALLSQFMALGDDEALLFDGSDTPMGTLRRKSCVAYALGIIGPNTLHDVDIIRRIRNDFAHSLSLDLTFDALEDECKRLRNGAPQSELAPQFRTVG
ncbi:MAG: hypothetical protein ACKVP3_20150 [Hyphomicrobiaceae bacterium]